jgi:imidazolonepropionase-like amidohydrolase
MILIKNAKILTMAGKTFENGYLLSQDDKIAYLGNDINEINKIIYEYNNKTQQVEKRNIIEIDAYGQYVLPGFIDAHCHVGMWEDAIGFEGDDGNEMTDPTTPQLRAIDGIYHGDRAFVEARESGVTTVVTGPGSANVIGGQFVALKTFGRCIDEMILKEPIAMKIAFGENPKSVYNEKKMMPMTRMATAALLREILMKTKEYMDKWDKYNKNTDENDKPEFDFKLESLSMVMNGKIPVKAHAHRADDILTALRIAKEFNLKITLDHCTEGHLIKDILYEKNATVILGPLLTDRSKPELRNQTIKNPAILSDMGLKVSITTDHPCVPIQYLSVSAVMAVKEGMNEEKALESITINPALATGISSRVGSLELGKDADIVIFDGNPLDLKSKVMVTIINGEIVYKQN